MTVSTKRSPLRRAVVASVSVTAVLLGGAAVALAAAPNAAPAPDAAAAVLPSSGAPAPYPAGGDGAEGLPTTTQPLAVAAAVTAGGCTYDTKGDNPHISSTAPLAVSAHGWWTYISGTCPSKANVWVQLQQYYCGLSCGWVTITQGPTALVYAGGGSANRATARVTCTNALTTGWRSVVDVDLPGISDPSNRTYMIANVGCRY